MEKRKGIKFAFAESDDDMVIVSMIDFRDVVYVASRKGIYKLVDDKLVRLEIIDKTPEIPLQAPESPVRA